MNGNFEYDRGSYPFQAVQIGNGCNVTYMPDQSKLHRVSLPRSLASTVALRVNSQYYAAKAGGHKFAVRIADVLDLIEYELKAALKAETVDGPTAMQITQRVTEERASL